MEKTRIETIFQNVVQLFKDAGVNVQSWQHEPILDFETDSRIAKSLGWIAEPTKSLFLTRKDGRDIIFMTHRDSRMDSKKIKQLLGSRPSIGSNEYMQEQLGCVPGAVCPFGLPDNITLVVDQQLLNYQELSFTPGHPEITFAFAAEALPQLLEKVSAPAYWL